ncbi:MAG: hypothetical protein QOK61_10260 [Nitrososphaeraceae archaeon]|nr:hypothetical protein [Nitrososphaeraceae archaeon]MDW3654927.1 hypothetical protein [Nitrososphaeraceae archaeon]
MKSNNELKELIKILNIFYEIFEDDKMISDELDELGREHFILSRYIN